MISLDAQQSPIDIGFAITGDSHDAVVFHSDHDMAARAAKPAGSLVPGHVGNDGQFHASWRRSAVGEDSPSGETDSGSERRGTQKVAAVGLSCLKHAAWLTRAWAGNRRLASTRQN